MSRYKNDRFLGGIKRASADAVSRIRAAQRLGLIQTREKILKENQRLDHLAHEYFGDSTKWWILAATSNIGWGLQVPAGTVINVPVDLSKVEALV